MECSKCDGVGYHEKVTKVIRERKPPVYKTTRTECGTCDGDRLAINVHRWGTMRTLASIVSAVDPHVDDKSRERMLTHLDEGVRDAVVVGTIAGPLDWPS